MRNFYVRFLLFHKYVECVAIASCLWLRHVVGRFLFVCRGYGLYTVLCGVPWPRIAANDIFLVIRKQQRC